MAQTLNRGELEWLAEAILNGGRPLSEPINHDEPAGASEPPAPAKKPACTRGLAFQLAALGLIVVSGLAGTGLAALAEVAANRPRRRRSWRPTCSATGANPIWFLSSAASNTVTYCPAVAPTPRKADWNAVTT